MSDDLIARLLAFEGSDDLGNGDFSLMREAADALREAQEIKALQGEVAEWKRVAAAQAELHVEAEDRAKRLEEVLRQVHQKLTEVAMIRGGHGTFAGTYLLVTEALENQQEDPQ